MKRTGLAWVCLVVAAGLVLSMGVAASAAAPKKLRIGVSIPAADHGWTAGIIWWAQQAIKQHPDVEFTLATAVGPDKQVADIEDMLVKGIDALVLLAHESAPLTPIAKRVKEQGIWLTSVDRGLLEPVEDLYVAGDNYAFGRQAALYLVSRMTSGNIVILEGIPSVINTERVTGFMDVLRNYPGIKVLASQPAYWQRERGLQIMEDFLQAHPKIDAVWAADDDVALGVIQAIREAGRENEMFVIPGAGMKEIIKMVMDGSKLIPVDITYPPSMVATAINLTVMALEGEQLNGLVQKKMPRKIILAAEVITQANAKDYYVPDSVY